MVQQFFDFAADERVQIPKLVAFHQVGVIRSADEVGVIHEEQISDVIQVDEAVERGRLNAVFPAQIVAEQSGRLVQVMDEGSVFREDVCDVMVDDDPFRLIHPVLKGEVCDPGGAFAQIALSPKVVVVGFKPDVRAKKLFGEPLEKDAREQSV